MNVAETLLDLIRTGTAVAVAFVVISLAIALTQED